MKVPEEKKEPGFFHEVDFCYKKLEELKLRASHLRKIGKDPTMAEFLMRNIIAKLHYAEVARNIQDIDKIKATLNEVKEELDEAEQHQEPSFEKDVEALQQKTNA
jgi:hypothetical protein